jgi:HD-GYP domain-containing protein (c-di-GMP phosphodiesterase class II)
VARAAELHDIGKLGIRDTILHKPGALSLGELAYVREHTLVGEQQSKRAGFPGPFTFRRT